ncbi:hypothetical protein PR048_012434 [Dryococelus australis]|uniref:Uncharacterized protein n=1 Tax=Dryococelus australis TaxID=614101 RepID=A0ABQ9HPZ4_9NEOP|nr:hypothetical protein PR048_012434 [Dryococelus australis]
MWGEYPWARPHPKIELCLSVWMLTDIMVAIRAHFMSRGESILGPSQLFVNTVQYRRSWRRNGGESILGPPQLIVKCVFVGSSEIPSILENKWWGEYPWALHLGNKYAVINVLRVMNVWRKKSVFWASTECNRGSTHQARGRMGRPCGRRRRRRRQGGRLGAGRRQPLSWAAVGTRPVAAPAPAPVPSCPPVVHNHQPAAVSTHSHQPAATCHTTTSRQQPAIQYNPSLQQTPYSHQAAATSTQSPACNKQHTQSPTCSNQHTQPLAGSKIHHRVTSCTATCHTFTNLEQPAYPVTSLLQSPRTFTSLQQPATQSSACSNQHTQSPVCENLPHRLMTYSNPHSHQPVAATHIYHECGNPMSKVCTCLQYAKSSLEHKMTAPDGVSKNTSRPPRGLFSTGKRGLWCFALVTLCSAAIAYGTPQVIRVQSSAGLLRIFHMWESCRTMLLVGGFSRDLPFPTPFHSGAEMQERRKREILEKTRRPAALSGTISKCDDQGRGSTPPGIEPGSPWSRRIPSVWSGRGSIHTPSVSPGHNWSGLPLTFHKSGNLSRPPPAYGVNHCQYESDLNVIGTLERTSGAAETITPCYHLFSIALLGFP